MSVFINELINIYGGGGAFKVIVPRSKDGLAKGY